MRENLTADTQIYRFLYSGGIFVVCDDGYDLDRSTRKAFFVELSDDVLHIGAFAAKEYDDFFYIQENPFITSSAVIE